MRFGIPKAFFLSFEEFQPLTFIGSSVTFIIPVLKEYNRLDSNSEIKNKCSFLICRVSLQGISLLCKSPFITSGGAVIVEKKHIFFLNFKASRL